MSYLRLILVAICLVNSCSDSSQERTPGVGNNPNSLPEGGEAGDDSAPKEDEETVDANEPVQVAGAYLTAEFIPDLPEKTPSQISIGGRIEKNLGPVDLTGLTVTGVVFNTASGKTVETLIVDLAAVEIQYKFNLNASVIAEVSLKIEIADADGKKKILTRNLKDLSGVLLTSLTPDQTFDFSNLTKPAGTLSAANFCDATGPMTSVKKTVVGVATTIATMTPGSAIALSKANHCFRKITDYSGTGESSLLAAKEKLGTYIGSGQANGGSLPCLFVVFEEIGGTDAGKPKLFVLKRTDDGFEANLRKTVNEYQCK